MFLLRYLVPHPKMLIKSYACVHNQSEMLSPRGQSFGLGLKHLASARPLSAAEEPAVKKRLASLFADYRTSHNDTCRR